MGRARIAAKAYDKELIVGIQKTFDDWGQRIQAEGPAVCIFVDVPRNCSFNPQRKECNALDSHRGLCCPFQHRRLRLHSAAIAEVTKAFALFLTDREKIIEGVLGRRVS